MSSPRVEKAYERYAWVILFLYSAVFVLPAAILFNLILGADVAVGVLEVAFGIPTALIAVTSYRKGRRWAWYAMWSAPLFLVASTTQQVVIGMIGWEANVFIVFPLLGLLLPYRKFFPKSRITRREKRERSPRSTGGLGGEPLRSDRGVLRRSAR